ncbi:hypothetical protein ACFWWC_23505 [Streptomyces sp. NPDC058642]|uniref:hypothetical protein n=1 Tax=Streptomyces sp. NPDC058642 TaxID=3346572 RepID=UPI0036527349
MMIKVTLDHSSSSVIMTAPGGGLRFSCLVAQSQPGQQYQAGGQAIEQESGPGRRL